MDAVMRQTKVASTESFIRNGRSPQSVDIDRLRLREFLNRPDIEGCDPCEIFEHLKSLPHHEVVPEMLAWRMSGDLWKVTMASVYFKHADVSDTIEQLIHQVESGNVEEVEAASSNLAQYGEVALRKVLKKIQGPNLELLVREIFSRMDGRVIPIVFKRLRNETLAVRTTLLRALVGNRNRHALSAFWDLLCEFNPPPRGGH